MRPGSQLCYPGQIICRIPWFLVVCVIAGIERPYLTFIIQTFSNSGIFFFSEAQGKIKASLRFNKDCDELLNELLHCFSDGGSCPCIKLIGHSQMKSNFRFKNNHGHRTEEGADW